MMIYNHIITLESFSDYWSNFISYMNKHHKNKRIIVTDKNNNKLIIPFNAEIVDYPIKIKIWED